MKISSLKLYFRSPLLWGFFFLGFFALQSTLIQATVWNIVEIGIGKNFFRGIGYVWTVGDPPALWRPIGGTILCGLIGLFVEDDLTLFRIYYCLCLTSFSIGAVYLGRYFDKKCGVLLSALILFVTPAFVVFPLSVLHFASHLSVLSVLPWAFLSYFKVLEGKKSSNIFLTIFLWIWVGLSRYELFLMGVFLFGYLAVKNRKVIPVAALLVVMLLKSLTISHLAKKHGLIQDSPIYHFYTGESHSYGYGTDDDGWNLAYQTYGDPITYHESLPRLLLKHPRLGASRIYRNCKTAFLIAFRDQKTFFLPWMFLFLIAFAFCRSEKLVRSRVTVFLLAFLSMSAILLFHIDLRYISPAIAILFFLVVYGAILTWGNLQLRGNSLRWLFVLFLVLSHFSVRYPFPKPGMSLEYRQRHLGETFKEVGAYLHAMALSPIPSVKVDVGETPHILDGYFAYYAETKAPFSEPPDPRSIPRDRLYSYAYQKPAFYLLAESVLPRFPQFRIKDAMQKFATRDAGNLFLFQVKN